MQQKRDAIDMVIDRLKELAQDNAAAKVQRVKAYANFMSEHQLSVMFPPFADGSTE